MRTRGFVGPSVALERENTWFEGLGGFWAGLGVFCGPGRTLDRENTSFGGSDVRENACVEGIMEPFSRAVPAATENILTG